MPDEPEFDGPAWLRPTAIEALQKYEAERKRRPGCKHEHLDIDGLCHRCGADCRGVGEGN